MSEIRKDPITGRWVITNTDRPFSPRDFHIDQHVWKGEKGCPFCPGNEAMTPPEIEAVRPANTLANTSGWMSRVVPNKFPALRIEGTLDKQAVGMYDMSNGIGAHEVIVDSPYHFKGISELDDREVEVMLSKYRSRSLDLRNDKRFKYILLFKNVGEAAGASLEHGHSQLIALPMVPKNVQEEIKGAERYLSYHERCIFCDMVTQELSNNRERIIFENDSFIAFCPLFSRFPFEVWIMPKEHENDFVMITDAKITLLSLILKQSIGRLREVLRDPPYNYIVHTSPVNTETYPGFHWHIEIMPKLTRIAGFEWGSGFYVVETPPEVSARYLRKEITLY